MGAIALRLGLLVLVIVAATWAAYAVRDALDLTILPENERRVHRTLMAGFAAYIGLLALPFVPGAEIGLAMLALFGAAIAPLIYVATVAAMMLAFTVGRLLPISTLVWALRAARMRRATALVERAAPLPREARLALLLDGAPPRLLALALRNRYLALALAVNVPGNSLIGGGGGIMLMAGLSGLFAPMATLLAVLIAVSPLPVMVYVMGM